MACPNSDACRANLLRYTTRVEHGHSEHCVVETLRPLSATVVMVNLFQHPPKKIADLDKTGPHPNDRGAVESPEGAKQTRRDACIAPSGLSPGS